MWTNLLVLIGGDGGEDSLGEGECGGECRLVRVRPHLDHRLVLVHGVQADLVGTHGGLVVGQLDPVEADGLLAVPEGSRRGTVLVVVSLPTRLLVKLPPSSISSPPTADDPLRADKEVYYHPGNYKAGRVMEGRVPC